MSDKRLDDMLSQWPLPERAQLEWDEAAERVVNALEAPPQRDAASLSDDALLVAPLPKLPEEGQTSVPVRIGPLTGLERSAQNIKSAGESATKPGSVAPGLAVENKMSKDRGRERTSFQELAKLASMPPTPPPPSVSGAQTPPPAPATPGGGVLRAEEASSTDSGIVDLKAIVTADPSGAHRAQSTPLASQGLFDDEHDAPAPEAAASAPPASSKTPAPISASASAAPATAAPAVAQAAATATKSAKEALEAEKKKGSGGVVIVLGTLMAVGAIAAGAFFFVKWQRSHHTEVAMTSVSVQDKGAETKAATPTPAGSTAQADDEETTVDTNTQPGAKPVAGGHRKHVKPQASVATTDTPAVASGGIDPKLVANVPTGAGGGGSGDLAEAMKAAAGGGTGLGAGGGDSQQGPKFAAGSVPQRPSQGQVQGAIGAVMGNVKACLGSDDPVSHANVVFQSDGTVKSVSVSGFAAGKPQEACIKGALSKAKVDPFAEASYSVPVSVRP